jgi:hypothetical protein
MTRNKWLVLSLIALFGLLGGAVTSSVVRGQKIVPEADREMIGATILRSEAIGVEILYTLDGRELNQIYTNDPRGGNIPEDGLRLIHYIRQDYTLTLDDVGMLDYQQAIVAWFKQAIEKREAILARMAAEGREQMTEAESASLRDETGRVAIFNRGPDPATVTLYPPNIRSINIEGDVAKVVVVGSHTIYELTMVYANGQWYIAGSRLLEALGS